MKKAKNIPVEHFLVDLRPIAIHQTIRKLQAISGNDDQKPVASYHFTDYELINLIFKINRMYPDDVDQHTAIKSITDSFFNNNTKWFFYRQALIYIIFFVAPFFV